MGKDQHSETATFGGGCFWCLEPAFMELQGVEKVEPGFAGGEKKNPSYREVCMGGTGHAEVVQVTFDPNTVTYVELLEVFFSIHDPTTLNRQGADVGTHYRSIILHHSEEQKRSAEAMIQALSREQVWRDPVVTEVVPLTQFYPAEDYHRTYFYDNPNQPYCQAVIAPKMRKFRDTYRTKLKG